MSRFTDSKVVITGGAGAIGVQTARSFLKEGAQVALVDMSADDLADAAKQLEDAGTVATFTADVTKEADVEAYMRDAADKLGGIDIFINNAGIEGKVAPIMEQAVENFDNVMAVNARGVFLGLKHAMRQMKDKGGAIVNMSSVAGLQGSPGLVPYITSKHAVIGLTKTAALEGAKFGIRVNSVHPAPVDSRMMRSIESGVDPDNADEVQKQYAATIPLGRYAETEDVAHMILFLASKEASYVTGAQYLVDGGMLAG
ncbi:SDR family NAD(P)-dependent oxidoreductase [Sulfitobacter sp. F26169L]|uniref:SDR family NAD(P)-dependent oxidoreductase n=1 Tax=Sulfitobacter sp. F26169L TaxID=2996015 RepID=UPI00226082A4|nr:SDR family oxidoreductase [Sulfitobacter sp. F26169L]MCX7564901.1 SDR family NAD(P)-dependent oxidoreductase [Sulfitobacter sp. F26169L]